VLRCPKWVLLGKNSPRKKLQSATYQVGLVIFVRYPLLRDLLRDKGVIDARRRGIAQRSIMKPSRYE